MAPEQTGRMNRSIDSRSDLYSFGVTLYEMLTGSLPFSAADPMEWVHCHIARQPPPPHQRAGNVPAAVSAIIMKLLAKTPEDRYQSAVGVESDLRRCHAEWQKSGRIDDFQLGEHDARSRLLIPEKLYGRAAEIDTLLAAFERIVAGGKPELILVSGYPGIGKSSVVNELHKPLVPSRGLFASGKFDQYKREIPFATLAQIFQSLVRPLLNKSDAELSKWREALRQALDPNGLLILDMVPELRHIIGDQLPVPELPLSDAQGRFRLVCRRFIGVFARPEHPLVLFFDDLQWLDAATLDLLEDLLTRSDLRHLLLIGAYRDNEVDSAHPLMRKLGALRHTGATIRDIVLSPLARDDLLQLLADSFDCKPEYAAPLAQMIHHKTAGNPFFATQFISALSDERLLAFDHGAARWHWDVNRIHAKGYTDNVVDLMIEKLKRLPVETQNVLQQLACVGNGPEFALLRLAYPDLEEMHAQLSGAVQAGVIFRLEDSYRFLHDRVQEAAYSMIPAELRAEAHVRIGRLLATQIPAGRQEEAIFEIVNQFNRGAHLLTSVEERERVAGLNLIAGRRARVATAYASSIGYLTAGRQLLTDDCWDQNYPLIFSIEYLLAECEVLTGDLADAEARLTMLAQRAGDGHDFAMVTRLRLTLYTSLGRIDRGLEVCLDYLRRSGTDWSPHPTREEAKREYDRIWSLVGTRSIEQLVDLPMTADPDLLDLLNVLTEAVTPALFYDQNLCSLIICRMVNLSLEHGNSDAACFAYVWFAIIAGQRFGNYADGFRFGRLGYELVETRGLTRYQARTYMSFGNIVLPWAKHAAEGRPLIRRAFDAAYRAGDLTFGAYSCSQLVTNFLTVGDPLSDVQPEAEDGLAFARRAQFGIVINFIAAQLALIRMLRGLTPQFGRLDHDDFDESEFERNLANSPVLVICEFWYCARKLQARFFAGDYSSAVEAALRAQELLWTSPSFEIAEFRFYGALSHAAAWNSASPEERAEHLDALTTHYRQLQMWAEHCPENFENRAALVGAEIARIQGRPLEAEQLYERAIRSAHANGFVHNEAVANEVAGRFYASRDLDKIARAYLRDARSCYLRWGADGKVQQLDRLYPHLKPVDPGPSDAILAPVEHLDLATVIKVSQAVSSEIVLEKLIDTLMRTAIENAGAARGLLILSRGDAYRIEAEATTIDDTVRVGLRQDDVTAEDLPESILHYVVRTKENVLLSNAAVANPFSDDAYIGRHRARSVLCLALLKQTKLIGVLYLENNLAPDVFTPTRMAILKLLASEAAISLENTRLYGDLREREARVRRLVDSNIIGICIWRDDGRISDANEAFLRIVKYDRDDLASGRLNWKNLTPAEWSSADQARLSELRATGASQPYEKEYIRKDGSRVPVLVGAAKFEEEGIEGVSFVLDLTEGKKAEALIRESERRYHEIQMELAHANRVATMGHLSASIAHEVNQPIAGTVINGQLALRLLSSDPVNIEELRLALGRIVRDGNRAGEIIGRIRAFVNKTPPRRDSFDINQAILDVIGFTQRETEKNNVVVDMRLADDLSVVAGDRIQLQQVILNLIINAMEAMNECIGSRDLQISTDGGNSDGILVTIRDSGPGIEAENLERIFDAFYTTKPDGLGMGLSICRGIIEAHGGRLWATTSPQGSIFQFTLPYGETESEFNAA
ncbi:MAG TPA: AAA family ATPase [Candidatus Sulfotelmatobacter sp.]|nr:AAA family ATPase [Candidatus Sulfotelmatobacter sp.]